MTSKTALLALTASTLLTAAANAGGIDMNEPRRALAREGGIRIDAQLQHETVSPGAPIAVTWQIQNFTESAVAVADRLTDSSYDEDTRTITVGIGSEVPGGGALPHLVLIAPGETKVLRTAVTPMLRVSAIRTAFGATPRYVQVKVTILRDVAIPRADEGYVARAALRSVVRPLDRRQRHDLPEYAACRLGSA